MRPPAWKTWTALGLVYVVWGSTYLAIHYVVVGLPPLLTAAARFAVASALLTGFLVVRRGRAAFRATARQWLGAALVGLLLLLGGNGGITLAERAHLPSGLTALLIAGVPLFVVLLRLIVRDRPAGRTLFGVALGFVGLAVLLLPGARPVGVSLLAAATVICSSALWAIGSFLASRLDLPADPLATTVGEMLGGAAGLIVVGLVRGEHLDPSHAGASALLAFGYLVVFGSVVAFTAYSWLLGTTPVSTVATYAYVNPVVAVLLGALIAGEPLTVTTLVGGGVTVLAVAVVVSQRSATEATGALETYVPEERQGRVRSSRT
jgi:drug/metabolite transporter (DMT)-like permease